MHLSVLCMDFFVAEEQFSFLMSMHKEILKNLYFQEMRYEKNKEKKN